MINRYSIIMAAAVIAIAGAGMARAMSAETEATIEAAVAIGDAVSENVVDAQITEEMIASFRADGMSDAEIRDAFLALRGSRSDEALTVAGGTTHAEGNAENNFGAFVTSQVEQGLRGRELAEAIHEEQKVRGMRPAASVVAEVRARPGFGGRMDADARAEAKRGRDADGQGNDTAARAREAGEYRVHPGSETHPSAGAGVEVGARGNSSIENKKAESRKRSGKSGASTEAGISADIEVGVKR